MAQLIPEIQKSYCIALRSRNPYTELTPCIRCVRKQAGDTCRFRHVRCLLKCPTTGKCKGLTFVETLAEEIEPAVFPEEWNTRLDAAHKKWTRRTAARALLPALKGELEHIKNLGIIIRPREMDVRATCDMCMTSVFTMGWMCLRCGYEVCSDCFTQTVQMSSGSDAQCCSNSNPHPEGVYTQVTRFRRTELEQAIQEMEAIMKEDLEALIRSAVGRSSVDFKAALTEPVRTVYIPPSASSLLPSHPVVSYPAHILSDALFHQIWSKGLPLLVTGLRTRLKIDWTPKYFIEEYGNEVCSIVECETNEVKVTTVGEFFMLFGNYKDRKGRWKLKDWPPTEDFRSMFPELYKDFMNAVPVPDYVRRDGVLNIASHFPLNSVAPDLGPKMYNALVSNFDSGGHGSTRLHMDMADALNIMTFASDFEDGSTGCAAWDLFRAEDADAIRKFLKEEFPSCLVEDPIHSQEYYLDDRLKAKLLERYGVIAYRIYQRPGEAVFIPAGCAHQVANMSDCIKVAVDFVSPENIARCEQLTKEFRKQNFTTKWKDDILQLRTMLWFAWQSCSR